MKATVLIGCPSGSDWKADFGMHLMQMVAYTCVNANKDFDVQFGIDNPKGSILSKSRNVIVQRALEMGASHILFIDTDMTFPAQTLEMLLAHEKPVVACNCATKSIPANPTARLFDYQKVAGPPLYTTPKTNDLTEVWRVGTGVMLIDTSVFELVDAPYFEILWKEEINDYQGEDWTFCEKLEKAGIPIYVDQHLSQAIGHIGTYTYSHDIIDAPAGLVDTKGKALGG